MGREISLFSDFHEKENRVTNYCGLILKMMDQESPLAFQETVVRLLGDRDPGFDILPAFRQQEKKSGDKKAGSIPDLILRQSSFNIYFEVKTTDWFYQDQIDRHLVNLIEEFPNADYKILFLLTSEFGSDIENRLQNSFSYAKNMDVALQIITFEEFLAAVKESAEKYLEKGGYINAVLPEFEEFLNRSGLLPAWKHMMDIVSCGATRDEIDLGLYVCPASGGSYSHARAKFFGAYWEKSIRKLFEISGIVTVQKGEDGALSYTVQWNNAADTDTQALIDKAKERFEKVEQWRKDQLDRFDLRLLVLDNGVETNLEKSSKGGVRSKVYWYDVEAETSREAAETLKSRKW